MAQDSVLLIREKALPIRGGAEDWDALLSLVGEARFVLLGEASHGTHEFYKYRAEITKRLIEEKGFSAVAVEADFPDAYRINRYVRGAGKDTTANDALSDFKRFPLWMWRNADILDFVGWLRAHNDKLQATQRIGFYGLDLYSLHSSMRAVLGYLEKNDPEAAKRARYRYSCFDHLGDARATEMGGRGEWNVGQLVREKYGNNETRLIGFTTHTGTVTATSNWDEQAQLKKVRPALKDSYELLFHETGIPNFFLNLRDDELKEILSKPLLERAIGVIYRPETERLSHYFASILSEQFDGVIHFDETRAVEPLDKVASWTHEDAPETYPEGI